MKWSKPLLLLPLLLTLFWVGCEKDKVKIVNQATGQPYELQMVIDKGLWTGRLGDSLRTYFAADMPGLPQKESMFRLSQIAPAGFGGWFVSTRNILRVNIHKDSTQTHFGIVRNRYARPQLMGELTAPSVEEAIRYLSLHGEEMCRLYIKEELLRQSVVYERTYNHERFKALQKKLNIRLYIPTELNISKSGNHFMWLSQKQERTLNLCVYTIPWEGDVSRITPERFTEIRDSVMRINIPGGRPDQYMATDKQTVTKDSLIGTPHQGITFRGLWQMENDAMGGPFVATVTPDTQRHRLVIAEGFVFNPNQDKRKDIRQLEAALRTLQL
jgi:hypothetical protein